LRAGAASSGSTRKRRKGQTREFLFVSDSFSPRKWSLKLCDNSRDEKRYAERKNKAERARKKKEDSQRLRELVDRALDSDPRIKLFKQREKEEREAKRKAKLGPDTKAKEEEERKKAEEAAKLVSGYREKKRQLI
jgi:hypothetical protein